MRGIITTLAVCSFAAASFAATLMPASGVYYPGDINNSGLIHVEFNDSVGTPTATISVNGSSVNVYSLDGGLVKSNMNISTINTLGRGLYIVNGKKILVK